jgi:hypothetical protein
MSPEQIRNEPVDARTDVYALGVLLYELSTGRLPFESHRPMEVLMLHVTERPKPPSSIIPDFDRELERVISKALEKDPDKRYPNMRALRHALRQLIDEEHTGSSGHLRRISVKMIPAAADFSMNPREALAALKDGDDRTQSVGLQAFGEALRNAVFEGNIALASELLTWVEERFADPALRIEEREGIDRALRVLRDPTAARAFAGQLLSGKVEPVDTAFPILAISGPVAARSLIDARRVQPPSLETRGRFVACLRATGPAALPVILAGLEPLVGLATRGDETLADDLMRAAPDVRSDVGGELTRRFVRPDKPALAVVALHATVGFWGPRSHALLLGILDSAIDQVRIAALEELQRLRSLDDWAIERIGRILLGHSPASVEVRVAAAGTLAFAPFESRGRVIAFIHERLVPNQGLVGSLIKAFGAREPAPVVVALARSLQALDSGGARAVLDKLVAARPELAIEIATVISGR